MGMSMGPVRKKVLKSEANSFVEDLTRKMEKSRTFYNVKVKPHKGPNYVWVVIG